MEAVRGYGGGGAGISYSCIVLFIFVSLFVYSRRDQIDMMAAEGREDEFSSNNNNNNNNGDHAGHPPVMATPRAEEASSFEVNVSLGVLKQYANRSWSSLVEEIESLKDRNKRLGKVRRRSDTLHKSLMEELSRAREDLECVADRCTCSCLEKLRARYAKNVAFCTEGEANDVDVFGEAEQDTSLAERNRIVPETQFFNSRGDYSADVVPETQFAGDAIPATHGAFSDVETQHNILTSEPPLSPAPQTAAKRKHAAGAQTDKDKNEPSYKYEEVVRGKEKRRKLRGFACKECEAFYMGLHPDALPGGSVENALCRHSRHRHRHTPPSTPKGYWDIATLSSQAS